MLASQPGPAYACLMSSQPCWLRHAGSTASLAASCCSCAVMDASRLHTALSSACTSNNNQQEKRVCSCCASVLARGMQHVSTFQNEICDCHEATVPGPSSTHVDTKILPPAAQARVPGPWGPAPSSSDTRHLQRIIVQLALPASKHESKTGRLPGQNARNQVQQRCCQPCGAPEADM